MNVANNFFMLLGICIRFNSIPRDVEVRSSFSTNRARDRRLSETQT